ncbi:MAG: hypothetical protein R3Y07_05200 [Eubacteriales bacterium]
MRLDYAMDTLIGQYGQPCTLYPLEGEPIETRAFLQIATDKGEELVPTPLGVREQEIVHYYGYAKVDVVAKMGVLWNGEDYVFLRVSPVFSGENICYYRGVLRRKGGDCGARTALS